MRTRIKGFGAAVLMAMAIGGLTAPPSFATDYFIKYLNTVPSTLPNCDPQTPSGPRHGSVVFKRTATTMSATVYLRGAPANEGATASLIGHSLPCGITQSSGTTDNNGNLTLHVGPMPRKGRKEFFVHVTVTGATAAAYETGDVPAFGL